MKPRTRLAEKLLSTCAIGAAIVALGGAGRLLAQDTGNVGFEGDPGSPPGVAIYRDYQHDEVDVTADKAVINWTPYDTSGSGPIDFLPAGHSVDYIGINGQDFTVLNRILPGGALEPIELNGAINSYILANDVRSTGGSVWFYSPGGIIVGSTAAFNVGGLLLTANDIPLDATGSFDPNNVRFVGTPGSTSNITINSGAQINAAQYVALIAPKIVQAGSIRADGQIAYIAAEKGTLTMPMGGGLFSISVDVDGGTSAGGTVIDHSGTTGGPAGTDPNLPHRIYMVTVAKNDAVTMLLGGNIGFDAASSATTDGDAVVLSAGRDVLNGDAVLTGAAIGAPASIQITNANVTSLLTANASGDLTLLADSGGTLSLAADTTAVADGAVTAHAAANSTITAGGNLTLTSARYGLDAGTAQVLADTGSTINVTGALNVIADADGSLRGYVGGGDAHGGAASLTADGGAITAGQINVSAVGIAQPLGTTKTTSYGGVASVTLTNNASLTAGGLLIDASAGESLSGFVGSNPGGLGADAQGGTASLTMTGGALNLTSGPLDIYASAQGGDGLDGGDATGGNAGFTMNGGTANLSGLYVDAGGFGGNALSVFAGEGGPPVSGGKGGDGKGGTVQALVNGGAFTSTYADMYAEGSGGNGGDAYDQIGTGNGGNGGVGGIGTGGSVGFEVDAGSATANNIYLSAFASGGQGGYSDDAVAGNGGDGVGGDVSLLTNGVRAQATFTTTYLDAGARGGTGGFSYQALAADVRGGNAAGGSVSMLAKAGMLLAGDATLSAVGTGGIAGRDENGFGIGGDARGGNVTAGSAGGALSLTSLLLDVDAFGGSGGGLGMEDFSAPRNGGGLLQPMQGPGALPAVQGGNATGGSATLSATAGGTVTVANGLTLTAQGTGGDGADVAGSGTGGSVSLLANSGGTISAAAAGGLAGLSAKGQGGAGGTAGGNGSGGTVIVTADKGAIDLAGGGEWYADGTGGGGANGNGGAGTGGTVTAKALNGGSIDAAGLTVGASGIGGQSTGGTGGLGQGGTILLSAQSGVISVADDSGPLELTATAEGTGGGGDTGGKGVGGGISLGATAANA
ncbi:MAG TPA: hypothetical protein VFL92_10285, partial [Sphingomonas sp.]|nr:hypothetical protein [Sphingomonas sp.]